MAKLAWLTDLHLNWIGEKRKQQELLRSIKEQSPDGVLITGDIAEGADTESYLRLLEAELGRPIYFVLGNHDFYGRRIDRARRRIAEMAAQSEFLVYLTAAGIVPLTPGTAVVGHDSWGDARLGDYENSRVWLPDFAVIEDLAEVCGDRDLLRRRLASLGDEAARHFQALLPEALREYPHVVVATHVPPYRDAAWYAGEFSDDNWLPFFACKAVGDVLRDVMQDHPDRQLLVLCGHTHGSGRAQILDNLQVLTGGPAYDDPKWRQILTFE